MKRILLFLFFGIPCLCRAFDVTVGSLVYRITDGVHASVLSPSEGHTCDSVFEIPNHITVDGLTYIVNELYSNRRDMGAFSSSCLKRIHLADSIEFMYYESFRGCSKLVSIVLPAKLSRFGSHPNISPFSGCDRLRYMIYLSQTPPLEWEKQAFDATTIYVADIKAYEKENGTAKRKIVPILSFVQETFSYTGQAPAFSGWKCNVENCKIIGSLQEPEMQKEVGVHRVVVPITFEYDGFTYTAEVASYYEIKPRTLSVSVQDITREYGEENPTFELSYSGFINNETPEDLLQLPVAYCSANKKTPAGEYENAISISGGEAKNYIFEYHPGNLTISKRLLQVSCPDYTRVYGTENPRFELEYSGFVNDEYTGALNARPIASCQASPTSSVGEYPISISGGEAKNYNFSYNNGTLSITQASQTLSWYQEFEVVYVDDQIELTASTSSGLPVEYEITPEGIADIYYAGDVAVLDCQKKGTITIKASQNGNENYSPAIRITKKIVISDPSALSITVQSNNLEWGTATITGDGTYEENSNVTITATPNEGYRFINWKKKDGTVFSTKAVHTFAVTENLELTANFKKIPDEPTTEGFSVNLFANNPEWGYVFRTGNNYAYEEGDKLTILALPNEGYRFVNWTNDGNEFSKEALFTFAITENIELTANFAPGNVATEAYETDNLKVYAQDHTIYLSESRGTVQVYNVAGQCVFSGSNTVVPVQQTGVYIVKVGARSYKVLVR